MNWIGGKRTASRQAAEVAQQRRRLNAVRGNATYLAPIVPPVDHRLNKAAQSAPVRRRPHGTRSLESRISHRYECDRDRLLQEDTQSVDEEPVRRHASSRSRTAHRSRREEPVSEEEQWEDPEPRGRTHLSYQAPPYEYDDESSEPSHTRQQHVASHFDQYVYRENEVPLFTPPRARTTSSRDGFPSPFASPVAPKHPYFSARTMPLDVIYERETGRRSDRATESSHRSKRSHYLPAEHMDQPPAQRRLIGGSRDFPIYQPPPPSPPPDQRHYRYTQRLQVSTVITMISSAVVMSLLLTFLVSSVLIDSV